MTEADERHFYAMLRGYLGGWTQSISTEDCQSIRRTCSNAYSAPLPERMARILADMLISAKAVLPQSEIDNWTSAVDE
jgi:hypothetical protein